MHAVVETEMQNKQNQKRKVKKQIRHIKFQLKALLTLILYSTLLHQINVAVKSRVKAMTTRHLNKTTVYNMWSYNLTEDEYNALVFGLDHHIPPRTNKNITDTEFEVYFQSINCYVNEIPDNKISHLKKKLRNICDRYNHIRVLYKFQKIVKQLSRKKSIMVLKQDKGRDIVVIDRKKYTEKSISLLHIDSFIQLDHDPTKTTKGKSQRSVRKMKNNLTKQEYSRLYPTGSSPGKFYGLAK